MACFRDPRSPCLEFRVAALSNRQHSPATVVTSRVNVNFRECRGFLGAGRGLGREIPNMSLALSMNQPAHREVLECASPLALSDLVRGRKSGRGLPQSKTLARQRPPRRGSWSQCMRKSERRLSMNRSAELQLRHVRRRKKTLIAPGWSPALQFRGSWSQCTRKCSTIPSQIAQRAVSL